MDSIPQGDTDQYIGSMSRSDENPFLCFTNNLVYSKNIQHSSQGSYEI